MHKFRLVGLQSRKRKYSSYRGTVRKIVPNYIKLNFLSCILILSGISILPNSTYKNWNNIFHQYLMSNIEASLGQTSFFKAYPFYTDNTKAMLVNLP